MTVIVIISIVTLILATYTSALFLALLSCSRSALERRLEAAGRAGEASWLVARQDGAVFAVSLLRMVFRMGFLMLVLVEAGWNDTSQLLTLTWGELVTAGLIAIALLWLNSAVIAQALARYADVGLVATALPMLRVLTFVFAPLTRMLMLIDEAVKRLTGANLREKQEVEHEFLRSIEDTHREGAIDEAAAEMLENIVEFSTTDVSEVMTPRTDIEGIALTNDLTAIRDFIGRAGHSRIPVYEENLDRIVGILYVKDLVPYLGEDVSNFDLRAHLRTPVLVPETKPVRELLADFQTAEVHLAIVVDEYGGTAGLATIEDLLEEIVGEIHDEHEPDDEEEPTITPIDDMRAEVDGRFPVDDINERLGLELPEDGDFDTIGGFVLATLGRVPEVGDTFEAHNARFTTLAATPTHIERLSIELLEPVARNGRRNGDADASK